MIPSNSLKLTLGLCTCLFGLSLSAQQTVQGYNLLDEPGSLSSSSAGNSTLSYLNDKNDSTVCTIPVGSDNWILFKANRPLVVAANVIIPSDHTGTAPKNFRLEGSNDGTTWNRIASGLGVTMTPREASVANVNTPEPYTCFRLTVTSVADGSSAEIAEWQLLGYPADDMTFQPHLISITGEYPDNTTLNFLANENAQDLFTQNNAQQCWIQYELDEALPITGYALMTGTSGLADSNPKSWELLGSNDGENWDILDSRFNVDFLKSNYNMQKYDLSVNRKPYDWGQIADEAHASMMRMFWAPYGTGYYLRHGWHPNPELCNDGFNYWWMAHAIDVFVDAYRRTGDRDYRTRANEVYNAMLSYCQRTYNRNDLWNGFFDDMEWMALASMRADDEWGSGLESRWSNAASQLWEWIKVGWNDNHGGGIQWNDQSPWSKNACSNAPAIIIAARMYKRTQESSHLDWAKKIWEWQSANLLFDNGIVKDSYDQNDWGWTFTYNQGTWIGACMELYDITHDEKYYNAAVKTADYVVNDWEKFSPNGILAEGEGKSDGGLFKGIFIRYLAQWILSGQLDATREHHYTQYLLEQGKSLWDAATLKPDITFTNGWQVRPARLSADSNDESERYDASLHLSCVMLFEALDELQRAGKLSDDNISPETIEHRGEAYKYYRLNVKSNNGGKNLTLSNWKLYFSNGSGIDEAASLGSWYHIGTTPRHIQITNYLEYPLMATVYDISGKMLAACQVRQEKQIAVSPGLCIVNLAARDLYAALKVYVR